MRRRELITLIGGGVIAWPAVARTQPADRMRRIAVLHGAAENAIAQTNIKAFLQGMLEFGWIDGSNVLFDYRWGSGNAGDTRKYAVELVNSGPDVILGAGTAAEEVINATRTLPIVFVVVLDPVGAGLVDSLSRPGGNVTGFMQFDYSLSAKWVELLKQIAPGITRVGVLRTPGDLGGIGQFAVIQSVAPSLGVEVIAVNGRDADEIKRAVAAFSRSSNDGLIVPAGPLAPTHRELIVALAAQHRLPAVFANRYSVDRGGLISYGPNFFDQYRRAAGYVNRILKGEKPADLPVQAPSKYELVINMKAANALGLAVPPSLIARADEVIE
jgi:ABC-type uncharacterized transport system substrate-binding protein